MKHENLVQFFGVCVEPPNVCIVMQYCKKGSLKVSIQYTVENIVNKAVNKTKITGVLN